MARRKKSVQRVRDGEGRSLPTAAETNHVARIARFRRFELPVAWSANLGFVRTFLDVFAYAGRVAGERERVVRLLNNARALAEAGLDEPAFARKLNLDDCLTGMLFDYARRQVRSDALPSPDDERPAAPAKTDLDALNEAFHDGDDAAFL